MQQGSKSLRWSAAVGGIAVATAVMVLPAQAGDAQRGAAQAGDASRLRASSLDTVLRYNFDNGESLRAGTRVRDVSGNRHHGTVIVSGSGQIKRVPGVTGRAAKFPRKCKGCGRAIIEASDERGLEPRKRAFRFGAAVRVTDNQATGGKDPNIIQKGLINQPGGQWKLELVGARPRCVIQGRGGKVLVSTSVAVDDGTWHTLECARVGRTVTLRIDGAVANQSTGSTGRITNDSPVRVGGKGVGANSGNDQYHGAVDNVYVKIKRR